MDLLDLDFGGGDAPGEASQPETPRRRSFNPFDDTGERVPGPDLFGFISEATPSSASATFDPFAAAHIDPFSSSLSTASNIPSSNASATENLASNTVNEVLSSVSGALDLSFAMRKPAANPFDFGEGMVLSSSSGLSTEAEWERHVNDVASEMAGKALKMALENASRKTGPQARFKELHIEKVASKLSLEAIEAALAHAHEPREAKKSYPSRAPHSLAEFPAPSSRSRRTSAPAIIPVAGNPLGWTPPAPRTFRRPSRKVSLDEISESVRLRYHTDATQGKPVLPTRPGRRASAPIIAPVPSKPPGWTPPPRHTFRRPSMKVPLSEISPTVRKQSYTGKSSEAESPTKGLDIRKELSGAIGDLHGLAKDISESVTATAMSKHYEARLGGMERDMQDLKKIVVDLQVQVRGLQEALGTERTLRKAERANKHRLHELASAGEFTDEEGEDEDHDEPHHWGVGIIMDIGDYFEVRIEDLGTSSPNSTRLCILTKDHIELWMSLEKDVGSLLTRIRETDPVTTVKQQLAKESFRLDEQLELSELTSVATDLSSQTMSILLVTSHRSYTLIANTDLEATRLKSVIESRTSQLAKPSEPNSTRSAQSHISSEGMESESAGASKRKSFFASIFG